MLRSIGRDDDMKKKTYALVKIVEMTEIELANALDEYDAAFSIENDVKEIADTIKDLLEYRNAQKH